MEEEIEEKHKLLDRMINYGLNATQKSHPRIASWIRLFIGVRTSSDTHTKRRLRL